MEGRRHLIDGCSLRLWWLKTQQIQVGATQIPTLEFKFGFSATCPHRIEERPFNCAELNPGCVWNPRGEYTPMQYWHDLVVRCYAVSVLPNVRWMISINISIIGLGCVHEPHLLSPAEKKSVQAVWVNTRGLGVIFSMKSRMAIHPNVSGFFKLIRTGPKTLLGFETQRQEDIHHNEVGVVVG